MYFVNQQVIQKGLTDPTYTFPISIFQPHTGFITGGGRIDSPAGAVASDLAETGYVEFGFGAKYRKKSLTPKGSVDFVAESGSIYFHSTALNWIVVVTSSDCAKVNDMGELNGDGNEYEFSMTVCNNEESGTLDTFRMQIWTAEDKQIVYDNLMGNDDNGYAGTELSDGDVHIH